MQEVIEKLKRIEAAIAAPTRAYLPVTEAAGFLGLSRQQLDLWRMKGGGPAYHKVGRKVLYSTADLRAFMARRRNEPLT
ncbi:MAG: helix-turn-helix domain-containing protein [Novosphingobium sp.]|nr:helix-turn-helix domain-containing protein [Novosphingobium sp.]